ncbi:MAG: hypothetical protein AAF231_10645 [Pseudomonadota bacterium]
MHDPLMLGNVIDTKAADSGPLSDAFSSNSMMAFFDAHELTASSCIEKTTVGFRAIHHLPNHALLGLSLEQ